MATASVTPAASAAPTVHPTLKPAPTVTLWLRDGNHYYKPFEQKNHKLKPLFGLVKKEDGTLVPTEFSKGVYCLRYRVDGIGKRTWEPVGNEPQQAEFDRGKKELALHALVNDMSTNDKPVLVTSLTTAGAEYLAETLAKSEAKQLARATYTASGTIILTTGTATTAGAILLTLTFNKAFATSPRIFLSPSNAQSNASAELTAGLTGTSAVWTYPATTYFLIQSNSTAVGTGTNYGWNYWVVG